MPYLNIIPYLCGAGGSTLGCEWAGMYLYQKNFTSDLLRRGINAQWQDDIELSYIERQVEKRHSESLALGHQQRNQIVFDECQNLYNGVTRALQAEQAFLVMGGDHSMGAGSISAIQDFYKDKGRIGVIWVDAHADINTPRTSPSQALHGMPVAALLGDGLSGFVPNGNRPVLGADSIYYLGIRDLDQGEELRLDNDKIAHKTAFQVIQQGYLESLQDAITHLSKSCDYIYLSVDLDAFDPQYAPAVGTPVSGGLSPDLFMAALKQVSSHTNFLGMEITEFNPTLSGALETYNLILDLVTLWCSIQSEKKSTG